WPTLLSSCCECGHGEVDHRQSVPAALFARRGDPYCRSSNALAIQNRSATPALMSWTQTPVLPALTTVPSDPPSGLGMPETRDAAASAVAVGLMYGLIASPGRGIELT